MEDITYSTKITDKKQIALFWFRFFDKLEVHMPETFPDSIIYLEGYWDDYEESYEIHYTKSDKYYVASDGHCSCYGFSAFDPIEFDADAYLKYMKRRKIVLT